MAFRPSILDSSALSKRRTDSLHNQIVDFSAFLERRFAQFVDRLGQVDAGMDDIRAWSACSALGRRASADRGSGALGHPNRRLRDGEVTLQAIAGSRHPANTSDLSDNA